MFEFKWRWSKRRSVKWIIVLSTLVPDSRREILRGTSFTPIVYYKTFNFLHSQIVWSFVLIRAKDKILEEIFTNGIKLQWDGTSADRTPPLRYFWNSNSNTFWANLMQTPLILILIHPPLWIPFSTLPRPIY